MKIATWNVNSLKVRLLHVIDWAREHQPDVIALQETKLTDDKFPLEAIAEAGYHAAYAGQKTYNGVAILSRSSQEDVQTDITGLDDPDRRILAATIAGVRVAKDLTSARIYVSYFGDQEVLDDTVAALNHAAGFVQARLGKKLRMRHTPKLRFIADTSISDGFRITQQIRDVSG